MIENYPLHWPADYRRNKKRNDSRFRVKAHVVYENLLDEIRMLSGDINPIISTNIPQKIKGTGIYLDMAQEKIDDPGAAVYFIYNKDQRVICCDAFTTVSDNLHAICLTIQALRGIDRWHCSEILSRTFTGMKALPENTLTEKMILEMFGFNEKPENIQDLKNAYKKKVKKVHPDKGGNVHEFYMCNQAYQLALKWYE